MNFSKMKDFLDSLVGMGIPGSSVKITKDGKDVFEYACGFADMENKIPMTTNTSLYMYSASKPVTVTAALLLFERENISLDTPLYTFIPQFKNINAKTPITLYHLFTMTAGLTYNLGTQNVLDAIEQTGGRGDTMSVLHALAKDGVTFEPGTTWQYSLCHDVLAGVVEIVSGMRFCDYIKENIFEPCNMNSSLYHPTSEQKAKMARQYVYKLDEEKDLVELQKNGGREPGRVEYAGMENSLVVGDEYDSGGAGIVSTVSDMCSFASALVNGKLLCDKTMHLMRTNTLSKQQLKDFNWLQHKGYGYGLGVRTRLDENGNTDYNGGFGWSGAAGATVMMIPSERIALAYAHHMLNPWEDYYLPKLCETLEECMK